jgi:hypothetical protein
MTLQHSATKLTMLVVLTIVGIIGGGVSAFSFERSVEYADESLPSGEVDYSTTQRPLQRDLTRLFEILGASHHGWSLVDDSRPPERGV